MTLIKKNIFETPGFNYDLSLSPHELSYFRQVIEEQWYTTIATHYPECADRFRSNGVPSYHKLSHLINHSTLWTKENRILPQGVVESVKKFSFYQNLLDIFGIFSISDVVYGGTVDQDRQEIYWRLVRPNEVSDVGPIHADKWFHSVLRRGQPMFPPGVFTVKIWVPIYSEPGMSGLIVVPESHKKIWRFSYEDRGGEQKPTILEDIERLNGKLIPLAPGRLLLFNENLLHGGAVTRGEITRVSMEITMVFDGRKDPR